MLLCLPSRLWYRSNLFLAIDCPSAVTAGVGDQTSSQDNNSLNDADVNNSVPVINKRFQHAFGASLLPEGNCYDDSWCKLWLRLVAFKNCRDDLPNGSDGRGFVASLSSEIDLLTQGSIGSERVLVFLSTMLQQDPMVQKGTNIHCLLGRHLQH